LDLSIIFFVLLSLSLVMHTSSKDGQIRLVDASLCATRDAHTAEVRGGTSKERDAVVVVVVVVVAVVVSACRQP